MTASTELLTVREVAERARVSERTARNWIHTGLLPGVQLGGHLLRVQAADLDAFLSPTSSQTTGTTA